MNGLIYYTICTLTTINPNAKQLHDNKYKPGIKQHMITQQY